MTDSYNCYFYLSSRVI